LGRGSLGGFDGRGEEGRRVGMGIGEVVWHSDSISAEQKCMRRFAKRALGVWEEEDRGGRPAGRESV
jgi:hypothetical protein